VARAGRQLIRRLARMRAWASRVTRPQAIDAATTDASEDEEWVGSRFDGRGNLFATRLIEKALSIECSIGAWAWGHKASRSDRMRRSWRQAILARAGAHASFDLHGNVATPDADSSEEEDGEGQNAGEKHARGSINGFSLSPVAQSTPSQRRGLGRESDAASVASAASDRTDLSSILGSFEARFVPNEAAASALDWNRDDRLLASPSSLSPSGVRTGSSPRVSWKSNLALTPRSALMLRQGGRSEEGKISRKSASSPRENLSDSRGPHTNSDGGSLDLLAVKVIDAGIRLRTALGMSAIEAEMPSPTSPDDSFLQTQRVMLTQASSRWLQ